MIESSEYRAWIPPRGSEAQASEPSALQDGDMHALAVSATTCAHEWGDGGAKTAAAAETLWKDPSAHPVVLLLMVLDRYGQESLDWAPEVLRVTMMRDGLQVSGASWAKILAMRVLVMSPSPWRQWDVFAPMARALAGFPPNFTYLEEPDVGHLMVLADIMKVVDRARTTSIEVDKFTAAALREDGQVYAPAPLDFAARELSDPKLFCKHCGAIHRDDNDTKCITCGSSDLHPIPYVFQALHDQCKTMFESRRSRPFGEATQGLPEDAAGNLVYQLLGHWDYARGVRQRLLQQLRALTK